MAATKVINVKTSDSTGTSVTYNIDNPKNIPDPLTRASIAAAFQYGIDNAILVSSKGNPIVSIDQIAVSSAEKIILEGGAVYVTPSEINITRAEVYNTTLNVNTMIQAASYIRTSSTQAYGLVVTSIKSNAVTGAEVEVEFDQPDSGKEDGVVRIVVNGRNINIPVTINFEE